MRLGRSHADVIRFGCVAAAAAVVAVAYLTMCIRKGEPVLANPRARACAARQSLLRENGGGGLQPKQIKQKHFSLL